MNDTADLQLEKLRQARDLVVSCLDVLLDNISGPEWLTGLGNLANCDSLTCVWWPAGRPDAALTEAFGPVVQLPVNLAQGLDQLITSIAPDRPGLVDELAEQAGIKIDAAVHSLLLPEQLIVSLDWQPACVFLIFRGRKVEPNWQEYDRERMRELLPIIQKSVAIKKRLSKNADAIELSSKINDESSRGFITLMPNGRVIATNRLAGEILKQQALIRLNGDTLEICDPQQQIEFKRQLADIDKAGKNELSAYCWYRNIGKLPAVGDLLLTMRAFSLENWRRESSPHSKTVVVTLETMQLRMAPEEAQLREFYNLTKAQARLVKQLMYSSSVEDAANTLNISVNTARSHLRAIYERMGVSNKAQLLQQVASTIAGRVEKSG